MNTLLKHLLLLTIAAAATTLSACSGCNADLECGPGLTLNDDHQCVPQDAPPTACGEGTTLVGTKCIPRSDLPDSPPDMRSPDAGSCTPDCDGRVCGDDGCDGSCGTCQDFERPFCDNSTGQCVATFCQPICLDDWQCGDDGCGGQCGACPADKPFCGPDRACQETCAPSCDGKSCGDDGCGGSCGQCSGAQRCSSRGACIPEAWTCAPDAFQDGRSCDCACGAPDPDCTPDTPAELTSGCALKQRCAEDGTCQDTIPASWTCSPRLYAEGTSCDCACGAFDPDCADPAKPIHGCEQLNVSTCNPDGSCGQCVPDCDGKSCGDDGCGGSCGQCPANAAICLLGQCTDRCNPTPVLCTFNTCGDDGCGGSCGSCRANETCDAGQCVGAAPANSCAGRCGGAAPAGCSCAPGCAATGSCCNDYVAACSACVPDCNNKNCGDDGCGGQCGACDLASAAPYCDPATQRCGPPPCLPQCSGKSCGDDGCGGSCGACQAGQACFLDQGQCAPDTWLCDPYDYNDGTCDCGCGAPDPDCAPAQLNANNCPSGVACVAGRCDMPRCQHNSECISPLVCAGAYYDAERRFNGACVPDMSTMTGLAGMVCADASTCNASLCIEGACAEHCISDSDCFGAARCIGVQPENSDLRAADPTNPAGWVAACVFINGSADLCTSNADCTAPNELCLAFADGLSLEPRYMCALPDTSKLGMPCGTSPSCTNNLQCVTSTTQAKLCAHACPGGQADCGAGASCTTVTFNDLNTPLSGDDILGDVCIP